MVNVIVFKHCKELVIVIGKRLRELRERRGLTQGELASRIGKHINQVSKWENGGTRPDAEGLESLARELECSVDYLLGLVDQPTDYTSPHQLEPHEYRLLSALDAGDIATAMQIILDVYRERPAKAAAKKSADRGTTGKSNEKRRTESS